MFYQQSQKYLNEDSPCQRKRNVISTYLLKDYQMINNVCNVCCLGTELTARARFIVMLHLSYMIYFCPFGHFDFHLL